MAAPDLGPKLGSKWHGVPQGQLRFLHLRVCPGRLGGVAELSQHQADGSETQKGKRLAVEIFPILGQPTAAVEPGEGALDNPAFG